MDLDLLRKSIEKGNLDWKKHVTQRLIERGLTRTDVLGVLQDGEIIRDYPDDSPCPSALFLGFANNRPVHVVAAYNETNDMTHIITAYEPTLEFFRDDFKTKRKL